MGTTYDNETAADLDLVYAGSFDTFAGTIDPESLIAEAERATGLSNLGGNPMDEPGFRKRLDALCLSLEKQGNLTAIGRTRAHGRVLAMIISRLRIVDYIRQAPPLPAIRGPLIGTGMPRTGTSFLQALLAQDPGTLVPRTGHGMVPIPPPGVLADEQARLTLVRRMLDAQGLDADHVNAIHPFAANAEDEDVILQEAACGLLYQAFFNVPSFVGMAYADYGDLMAWQKQLMQVIQSQFPDKRWVLKAPEYLGRLDLVQKHYPDGMIFVNHRDPIKVVGSIASLHVTFQSLNSDRPAFAEHLGPLMIQGQAMALKAMEDWRAAHPDVKILDVRFADLVADPVAMADWIYSEFGLTLTDEARQSMADFLAVNRHGQASGGKKHEYTLEQFGITEDMIEEAFGDYLDRYGIKRERKG